MPHFPKPFFKKSRGLWYVEVDRRQINLGPDRDAAFRRYHEIMSQPGEQKVSPESLAVIVDWVSKHRSPHTFEWYRYRLQRLLLKYPDMRSADLRVFHVERWVDEYELSVTSRRNYLRSIKRCCKWAVRQGYLKQNPIAELEIPTGQRKETYVGPEDFVQLLLMVPDQHLRDLMIVTYETGCRPQESLRVEVHHVDLENRRWVFPQSEAKGKLAPRIVYLTSKAFAVTQRLMLENPAGRLFRNRAGDLWTTDAVNCGFTRLQMRMGRLQMQESGEVVADDAVSELASLLKPTRCCRGCEVPKTDAELRNEARKKLLDKRARGLAPRYSLYALRHSWATNALRRGVDPLTVAVLMGHRDPSTLARVYQHLSHSPEHMLKQAERAAG